MTVFKDPRRALWFGTMDRMVWFKTPLKGAEMSPDGWSAGGNLLNGGGYQFTSVGSNKVYTFEWGASSSVVDAQLLKSFKDGAFGRGLIYFQDPLSYEYNVLPARWANPGMSAGEEGGSLVYDSLTGVWTMPGGEANMYPSLGGAFRLSANIVSGFRGAEDAVFVPIPPGFELHFGAVYTTPDATAGVYLTEQNANGTTGVSQKVPSLDPDDTVVTNTVVNGFGVWVSLGKLAGPETAIAVQAMTARLVPVDATVAEKERLASGPWVGGMGNSGCRFVGNPTWTANGPLGGGQVGFSASLREVGSWAYV